LTQRRKHQNYHPYLITTNVLKRAQLFDDIEYASALSKIIIVVCRKLDCELYAYCIMPDHIHLLLQTNAENTISKVMQQIKSLSAKELRDKHDFKVKFWQSRFNHQIIDTNTGITSAIVYIKNNHIKWGLDEKYSLLPYLYIKQLGVTSWR